MLPFVSRVVSLGDFSLLAGMPALTLTDVTRFRLQTLSFFAMGVLVAAFVVRWLWDGLRRDFPRLPALSYRAALCGTVLWGLLFLFVLTMISGARELLTPGAWKKVGLTYRLAGTESPSAAVDEEDAPRVTLAERREALQKLAGVLFRHAARHNGTFPAQRSEVDAPRDVWDQPGFVGTPYAFVPGLNIDQPATVLAFEHQLYGDGTQLALWTDGRIDPLTEAARAEIVGHQNMEIPPSQ